MIKLFLKEAVAIVGAGETEERENRLCPEWRAKGPGLV